MMEIPELPQFNKKLSALEELEIQQKERRNSMQSRRMSLMDVIPDFPNLKKRKSPPKVHTNSVSLKNTESKPPFLLTHD